jgi:hypothetical protein
VGQHAWILAVGLPAATAVAVGLLVLARRRVTPEERERRRRLQVHAQGRITDGLITEVRVVEAASGAASHWVHYSYDLRGVNYVAAQDITPLLAHLARDPQSLGGPAAVKYLPDNPSNSIVVCEQWSGLR